LAGYNFAVLKAETLNPVLQQLRRPFAGYIAGAVGVGLVALLLLPFHRPVQLLTAADMLLVVVLLVAGFWGMTEAFWASVLAALCLNHFFVSNGGSFDLRIDGSADEIALVTFSITAIIVGKLSSRAESRARENRAMYEQLRVSFDRASQLEAIRRSERLKTALLDTVTHDVRTPLTSIQAAADTLVAMHRNAGDRSSASAAGAADDSLLKIIVQQSTRLNQFFEGMIELAKVESRDPAQLRTDPVFVEDIISAAVARAADLLHQHQVRVECDESLRAAVNPQAIAQVLFSLLENAAKYAPPETTIRVIAGPLMGDELAIAVQDQGPGVPPDVREMIFEKFNRGQREQTAGPAASGLGLGLAIARGIVESHRGKIWVENNPQNEPGARFVFTVPAVLAKQCAPTAEVAR
jgi:K+-sensing histidine kinase KdpD